MSLSKPCKSTATQEIVLYFIRAIFDDISSEAEAQILVCGFPGDPAHNMSWVPQTMQNGKLPKAISADHNCYVNLATFRQNPEGRFQARNKFIAANHAVVFDDVGTKCIKKLRLRPSWKIETSPGNFQVGFILKRPCKNSKRFKAVVTALGKAGWSDSGAAGTGRWVRLPFGVNTKEKYLDDGVAPEVKLIELHPKRRYSLNQIIKAHGLEIETPKEIKGIDSRNNADPVLSALKVKGLLKSQLELGKYDITCPWAKEHTSEIDHGTVFYEPSEENGYLGGFKCQHGHCANRTIVDLRDFLGLTSGDKKKPSDVAMEFIQTIPAYRDENGDPFVFIRGSCFPLKAREVKAHVVSYVHKVTGKYLRQGYVSEALAALEGRAICEGPQVKLELRTAKHKGWFLYDLGDGQNVKTGKSGWNIVEATPIFRRYSHQQAQVEPKRGGNPWDVFDFINIAKEHQLKTLVLLISYLVPGIAHPVFHPHGAHGSGKTTLCTMIKDLLDPSSLSVMIAPKNKQELIRQIHRHYISLFDNMSKLDSEMSDIICVACTGGSVAKRTLYTDDDDSIFNFKRCIGLNGINLLISKPDLLDRSMLLHLERIQAQDRKLEAKLLAEFSEAKPAILGGMFDILSKAKSLYSIKKPINKPRLADFATWGYAIAEALEKGYGKKFVAAYQANIKRQNTEVLQGNSLCIAVTQLLKSEPEWEGTIKEAYKKLFDIVEPVKTDGTFPTNERQLRRHLERIQTTLAEAVGITYCISEKPKNNGFHIVFVKK